MGVLDGLENVLGLALEPLEEADRLLGEAIEMMGEGMSAAGNEMGRIGEFVAGLAGKVEAIQKKLQGGGQ